MNQAVLLLAHGAPERLEDVDSYLSFVRGGRPSNPQVTGEVTRRYAAIGGGSPLLRWTRAQAEALERLLGIPVFFAMRNWHPLIQDVVPRIGAGRVAAVCLAPQYSEMSVGLYMRKVAETAPPFGDPLGPELSRRAPADRGIRGENHPVRRAMFCSLPIAFRSAPWPPTIPMTANAALRRRWWPPGLVSTPGTSPTRARA